MGITVGQDYTPKSEMKLLMEKMFIPFKEEPKSEVINIETGVTREIIDEILSASSPPGYSTGQQPEELQHSITIQTQLRNILGTDLAGYFDAEVSLRDRDAIVRIFYKASALGIGVKTGRDLETALKDAINVGMVPALKQLQFDLTKILAKLPWASINMK
jgi:hypothetical protein